MPPKICSFQKSIAAGICSPRPIALLFLFICLAATLNAQEMQPRAYFPAPVGISFFGISYSHNAGGLLLDPSLPVEDAHVVANSGTLSFVQSLGVLGRTAQALVIHSAKMIEGTYERYRVVLGKTLLVGLELLVAADIIRTVALDLTLINIGLLAGLVLVRTFLGWTLTVEVEGHWPWQKTKESREAKANQG